VVIAALGEASERTDPLTIVDDAEFAGMDIDELLARFSESRAERGLPEALKCCKTYVRK
jgi:hypothetical protein